MIFLLFSNTILQINLRRHVLSSLSIDHTHRKHYLMIIIHDYWKKESKKGTDFEDWSPWKNIKQFWLLCHKSVPPLWLIANDSFEQSRHTRLIWEIFILQQTASMCWFNAFRFHPIGIFHSWRKLLFCLLCIRIYMSIALQHKI